MCNRFLKNRIPFLQKAHHSWWAFCFDLHLERRDADSSLPVWHSIYGILAV